MTQAHATLDPTNSDEGSEQRGEQLKVSHYIELEATHVDIKPAARKAPAKKATIIPMHNDQKTDNKDAKFWTKLSEKYAKSKIRDEAAYAHTLERTKAHLKPSDHMLELGCGTGTTALTLAEHVRHYTATDFSQGMVEIAKRKQAEIGVPNLDFMQKSVEDLPFHETYDAVFASSLLHLVDDYEQAIARIYESVEPGGLFISKTACLKGANPLIRMFILVMPLLQMIGKAPHVNIFSGDELETAMRRVGFKIIEADDHNHNPACRFIVAKRV